jgi:hypothetical protein
MKSAWNDLIAILFVALLHLLQFLSGSSFLWVEAGLDFFIGCFECGQIIGVLDFHQFEFFINRILYVVLPVDILYVVVKNIVVY